MNRVVVKVEKSGNRFNNFDIDGVKYTSDISTSTRKNAHNNIIEKRINKSDRVYWKLVPMSEFESNIPVIDVSSVDVPSDHLRL